MGTARFGDLDEAEGSEPVNEALPATNNPILVGRDAEFAALRTGLEEAIAGRAGLFLITGEAGMGKSRLVEEVTSLARSRGFRVLSGRCWEAVDAPSYWPWIQVLRQPLRGPG